MRHNIQQHLNMTFFTIDLNAVLKHIEEHPNTDISLQDFLQNKLYTKLECIEWCVDHSNISELADDNADAHRIDVVTLKLVDTQPINCIINHGSFDLICQWLQAEDILSLSKQGDALAEFEAEDEPNLEIAQKHSNDAQQTQPTQPTQPAFNKPTQSTRPTLSMKPAGSNGEDLSKFPPVIVRANSAQDLKDFVSQNAKMLEEIGNEILKSGMPTVCIPLDVKDKDKS